TGDLSLFTNGKSALTAVQEELLRKHSIEIIETEIHSLEHTRGKIQHVVFRDGSKAPLKALYSRVPFIQHSNIPEALGCELTGQGLIKVDAMQRTSIPGVFASGDNSISMRSVAASVSSGSLAGAAANKELIDEDFCA
ncbi:MAG TPA: FAD-dependent oxidoreductase, partial [Anseongella sp.]|nr:FAD-dependent oxidoreductase [Anseongella sp.]